MPRRSGSDKKKVLENSLSILAQMKEDLPRNFPNRDEEAVAIRLIASLIASLEHSLEIMDLKGLEKHLREVQRARGQDQN